MKIRIRRRRNTGWREGMAHAYSTGLKHGKRGARRRPPNDFVAAYDQGYRHGARQRGRNPGERFIQTAIKRPGALTATLRRWRILGRKKSVKDLSAAQLDRAYARARRLSRKGRGLQRELGTRTMRQINFYRRVLKPASARRKGRKVTKLRVARRKAANRYATWTPACGPVLTKGQKRRLRAWQKRTKRKTA